MTRASWITGASSICTEVYARDTAVDAQIAATSDPNAKMRLVVQAVKDADADLARLRAIPAPQDDPTITSYLTSFDEYLTLTKQVIEALGARNAAAAQQGQAQAPAAKAKVNAASGALGLPAGCSITS